jgi:NADPH:quinone reductase-like Zn-dependent oxidoreductase
MKAAVLTGFGGVDKLEVREVPEPPTGPQEIKVRVVATSINPIDWKLREGAMRSGMALELPAILGRDAAGEIVEVGAEVSRFRVGAKVAGLVRSAYAERVVAKEDAWAEVPASMALADAAAVPLVALTGAQLIDEGTRTRAGDTVLVMGAVGGVGRAAVHVAKGCGAKVWAGVRASQRSAAAELGVDGIVALDDARENTELPLFDALADTVGGASTQKFLDKIKPGGAVGTVVGEPAHARERGLEVRQVWAHPDPERLSGLLRAVAAGALVIPIARRFTLAQIREAQHAAEHGAGGKVLVEM